MGVFRQSLTLFLSVLMLTCAVQAVLASGAVGVKTGDWVKYEYVFSEEIPAGTPFPEWMKVEFLSVEASVATARVTLHLSDGTEQSQTVTGDIVNGQEFAGLLIPVDSTTGDSVYIGGYGNVVLAGEILRTYAGAQRTVVYATLSISGVELTYYWDKSTGMTVEASVSLSGITGAAKAVETNMWETTEVPNQLRISFAPSEIGVAVGANFVVNVTIANVPSSGLYAYEYKIYYDRTVLKAISAELPPDHFLKPTINVKNVVIIDPGTIDESEGSVSFALSLMNPEEGKTGGGTLATVNFTALRSGDSTLLVKGYTLPDPIFLDQDALEYPPSACRLDSGHVTVQNGPPPSGMWDYTFSDSYGRGTVLNIDIENGSFQFITPDKDYGVRTATSMQWGTTIIVGKYLLMSGQGNVLIMVSHHDKDLCLTALALDKLDYCAATANDTAKSYFMMDEADTEDLATQDSNLALTSWLAEDASVNSVSSTQQGLQGFVCLQNCVVSLRARMVVRALTMTVALRTDLNGDLKVNILDVTAVAMAFGSKLGDDKWNKAADLNRDHVINVLDLAKVARDLGRMAFQTKFF